MVVEHFRPFASRLVLTNMSKLGRVQHCCSYIGVSLCSCKMMVNVAGKFQGGVMFNKSSTAYTQDSSLDNDCISIAAKSDRNYIKLVHRSIA